MRLTAKLFMTYLQKSIRSTLTCTLNNVHSIDCSSYLELNMIVSMYLTVSLLSKPTRLYIHHLAVSRVY